MTQERTILKEFDRSWGGKYIVQREFYGWNWQDESRWDTKAAAYYTAEELSRVTGDKTRVVV